MEIGIKSFGFDEAIQQLDKMAHGLTEEGINEYCDSIKKTVMERCGISDNEITLKATKVIGQDKLTIDFQLKDRKKLECVKQTIQDLISSMPVTTKLLFEQLLKWIDEQLKKTN